MIKNKKIIVVGMLDLKGFNESSRRVYDPKGICPCIPTCSGGGHCPKIILWDKQNGNKD